MLYIFPDTNIFIHGKHFEEIDWPSVTGSPEISIMLAPTVIAELDKHKHNSTKKVAHRVRKILPRILEIFQNPQSCKWKVTTILRRPATDFLEQHHFDPKDQDDVLLATILEFKKGIGEEDQVILFTNDTGPKLKAFSLNITAQSLSDDNMMPDEPDESEKKTATLQKELDQYKNKLPVVALQFQNDQNFLEVNKPFDIKSKQEYVATEMEKIKKKYPEMVYHENDSIMLPDGKRVKIALFRPRQEQVETYNAELKEFFARYEKYFASEYKQATFIFNCCKINIIITNTGTVPAQDLDIHMHFPDGFDVIQEDSFPACDEKPSPPYKPQHAFDIGSPFSAYDRLSGLIPRVEPIGNLSDININVGSVKIKKTNSYDVTVHVRSVKHNQNVALDVLWLKYDDMRKAKGFTIDYQIMAANIPNVVTGKLNVNFIDVITK